MRTETKNLIIEGYNSEHIGIDIFRLNNTKKKPVVIYAHGFNGFKDWGNFDLIAKQFADAGFVFVKFNFSHNGTSTEDPDDFIRLDLYEKNNYTKELFDLKKVIDFICDESTVEKFEIDTFRLYLIGHSLGGGISIITAAEDQRVKGLITWASVVQLKTPWTNWDHDRLDEWKRSGITHILNSRTKQHMPLGYQLYEDWYNNKERLDIDKAMISLKIPMLICHGSNDEAVNVSAAHHLKSLKSDAEILIVESDHVFGRKHPWTESGLPEPMQAVVSTTLKFLERNAIA